MNVILLLFESGLSKEKESIKKIEKSKEFVDK